MIKRNCFRCDKEIKTQNNGEFCDPPDDATHWTSTGNFGSTVLDNFHGPTVEIYICDQCLIERAHVAYQFDVHTERKVTNIKPWNPQDAR